MIKEESSMKPQLKLLCVIAVLACFLVGCRSLTDPAPTRVTVVTVEVTETMPKEVFPPVEGAKDPVPAGASALEKILAGDTVWLSKQVGPEEEGSLVRELTVHADGTYTIRTGDPDSEYSYWARGEWYLDGDQLTIQIRETDEEGNPVEGKKPYMSTYIAAVQDDILTLTQEDEIGLPCDRKGVAVDYTLQP